MCEIAYTMYTHYSVTFVGFFQFTTVKTAALILMLNTSKGVVLCRDMPFGGPGNRILHFDPIFVKSRKFGGDFWQVLEHFGSKEALTQ